MKIIRYQLSVIRIGRTSDSGDLIFSDIRTGECIYKNLQKGDIDFPLEERDFDCIYLAMLEVYQPNFIRETKEFGNVFELGQ